MCCSLSMLYAMGYDMVRRLSWLLDLVGTRPQVDVLALDYDNVVPPQLPKGASPSSSHQLPDRADLKCTALCMHSIQDITSLTCGIAKTTR